MSHTTTTSKSNTMNTAVKQRSRSKSVGEVQVDPEFAKMLTSRRVDAFDAAGAGMSTPVEIVYEESPDILDTLFESFVNILINVLPIGSAIMGGTAHVLMSKKFGIKPLNFLTNISVIRNGIKEEVDYTFKRDIDILLPSSRYFRDIEGQLASIGEIKVVKTATRYGGGDSHHNLRQIRKLTSIKLKIPLRSDAIKKMTSGTMSFFSPFFSDELFEKFPKQFVIDIDVVEIAVPTVSMLVDYWYVTNELRAYALEIKMKNLNMFATRSKSDNLELVPVQIASILPPSLTNRNGVIVIPLNTLFDYVKGLSWETSPLPGRTRSGMVIPPVTTKPMNVTSELDRIVRLANIHSDRAVIHVATPDFWIPHVVYDDSVTVDTIRETFEFGKFTTFESDSKRKEFHKVCSQRIFDHIHHESGLCCICMNSLNEPGVSFVALPCGCTSVMHLNCLIENYVSHAILGVMNSHTGLPDPKHVSCPLCRKSWWTAKKPKNQFKFRALRNEYSRYYTVEEIAQKTLFQLWNTKLHNLLTSNPKSIDFWDFVE